MKKNKRKFRVSILLSDLEAKALSQLGNKFKRGFRDQAYFSLRDCLEQLDLIPKNAEKGKTNQTEMIDGETYD